MKLGLLILGVLILPPFSHTLDVAVPSSSCLHQTPSLESLQYQLQHLGSDTVLYLERGEHCIRNLSIVQGVANVSIIGEQGSVDIQCAGIVGLAFVNVSNLRLQSLRIHQCGLTDDYLNSTITVLNEFVDSFFEIPVGIKVGLFLGQIGNLVIEQVVISDTDGIGLLGVNLLGRSILRGCMFENNTRPATLCSVDGTLADLSSESFVGGGVYLLYHNYFPDKFSLGNVSDTTLIIEDSTFLNNSDCSFSVSNALMYRNTDVIRDLAYRIGSSGGLALTLAQFNYGVSVLVTSSMFVDNTARYGGGANIQAFTGITNCRIQFENTTFYSNGYVRDEVRVLPDAFFVLGGGAVGVFNDLIVPEDYGYSDVPNNRNTSVDFRNVTFTANGGEIGGAVIVYSLFNAIPLQASDAVILKFIRCTFTQNSALFGAALWAYEAKNTAKDQVGLQIELQDLTVTDNMATTLNSVITRRAQDNSAAVHFIGINVTITGNHTYISNNEGTGLQSAGSLIGIIGSKLVVENNLGVYGGALNLLEFSSLIMTPGAELYLRRNQAQIQGGAIYTNLLGSSSIEFFDDCFLHFSYQNFDLCQNCSDLVNLGVYVEISENIAPSASVVYGSSLRSCPWSYPLRSTYPGESVFQILHNHFPAQFKFNPSPEGSQQVTTAPIALQTSSTQTLSHSTIPGAVFNVSLFASDWFEQNVSTVISAYIVDSTGQTAQNKSAGSPSVRAIVGSEGFAILSNTLTVTPVILESYENSNVTVGLYTIDSLSASQIFMEVSVQNCPTGFVFSNLTMTCECHPLLLQKRITCDIGQQLLVVPNGYWFGPIDNELTVHRCFEGYCEVGQSFVSVQDDPVNFDSQCTQGSNRGGLLCGRCREGYSRVLGNLNCQKCSNNYAALFVLFVVLGILLVIMISYFRITVTGGYLNGVLFYSNIISIYGQLLVPDSRHQGSLIFASFLSLNFGIESCLYEGMGSLEKVWWQLSFPLYLVFLIVMIHILSRCFRWKPATGFSLIQGIATLSVLCYVSVLQSCVELISATTIETLSGRHVRRWVVDPTVTYFVGWHAFLGLCACVLLVFYIIPLPVFLLFPSTLYRVRYLKKLKPFYDAFWDPFEVKLRFWLGLRLMTRWIPFALYFLQPATQSLFGTAVVLVVLQYFQLLLKPFKGFWRNALDGYFMLNAIVLLLSAVYFRATSDSNSTEDEENTLDTATNVSITLVTLAYVGFAAVFLYHVVVKYPKLEGVLKKMIFRKKPLTRSEDVPVQPPTTSVGFTELREPLLETSGTLEVVTFLSPQSSATASSPSTSRSLFNKTA